MQTARLKLISEIVSFVASNIIVGAQIVKSSSHDILSGAGDMLLMFTEERVSAMITVDPDVMQYLSIGISTDGRMVRLSPKGVEKHAEGSDEEALRMYRKLQQRFAPPMG